MFPTPEKRKKILSDLIEINKIANRAVFLAAEKIRYEYGFEQFK